MEALASLIHSAIFVYLDYVKESNPTVIDLSDLPIVAQFDAMYKRLGKRVEEFLLRCRKSADVTEDIRSATAQACAHIVDEHYCPAAVAQRAVHDRLESEYGHYDHWIVLAFPSKTRYKLSPRFRTVIFDEFGLVVTAFAIDRRTSSLSLHPLVVNRLRLFRPLYSSRTIDKNNWGGDNIPDRPFVTGASDAKLMYTNVRTFLTGLSAVDGTHLEIGVFVGHMERCGGSKAKNLTDKHPLQEMGGALIHPALNFNSSTSTYTTHSDYSNQTYSSIYYWLGSGLDCGYRVRTIPHVIFDVLVIPVSAEESSARISIQSQTSQWRTWTDNEGYHLMRFHHQGDVYLSVKDDSDREGAYIVVQNEWRNSSRGQRWKFHNNQLVNGHGLCLTAWYNTRFGTGMPRKYHYLYQYNCTRQWEGQRWRQSGMQVVNDVYPNNEFWRLAYCLAIIPSQYAVRSTCVSYNYGWVFWSTYEDMADVIVRDGVGKPIRNLKNGKYLSDYKDPHDKPGYFRETQSLLHTDRWNGEPGQKWRFESGRLKNEEYDDKCVAIDVGGFLHGGAVRMSKCDDKDMSQRLAYNNATKQIFGTKGYYCLGLNANNWHEIEYGECAEKSGDAFYQWDF